MVDYLAKFLLCALICADLIHAKKKETILDEKVEQLMEWSNKRPVIKLDGNMFRSLVKGVPRNYSVIVQFTALKPSRQCSICRQVNDEFHILANSWRYNQQFSSKLFFAFVDYDDSSDVFTMLDINSVPLIVHYPAKGKPKKQDTFDLNKVAFSAEMMARWISERTDVAIRIFRPPSYSGTMALILLVSLIGGILYLKRNNLEFLYNKTSWGVFSVVLILAMTSGQMWNHIRGAQLMYRNPQDGQWHYIHGSTHSQFIVESYIVIFLNAAIVGGMFMLSEVGENKKDSGKKKFYALCGLAVVAVFFSFMLSIFKVKHRGYPYSFLIK